MDFPKGNATGSASRDAKKGMLGSLAMPKNGNDTVPRGSNKGLTGAVGMPRDFEKIERGPVFDTTAIPFANPWGPRPSLFNP